jgi:Flp pilus assembly protein TadD
VPHSAHDLKALNLIALALTGAGQAEKGDRTFKEALDLYPQLYPATKNFAMHEFNLKRFGEAGTH